MFDSPSSVSDPGAVVIAHAGTSAAGCLQALQSLQLPHLQRLLARLAPVGAVGPAGADGGSEADYAPPHERALARALGLPVQGTPWAAWQSQETSQACAWVTPCYWQTGADQIHMHPPQTLDLSDTQARSLFAVLQDWLAQDDIALEYVQPLRWLARGALFDGLETAALERVVGRDVRHWHPRGPQQHALQRLHSEVQMLLYTHAFNDERAAQGQPPVNAIWFHGAGRLQRLPPPTPQPQLVLDLQASAIAGDWPAWAAAWQQVDARVLAPLAQRADSGQGARLTLCGESAALSWQGGKLSLSQRMRSLFRPQRLMELAEEL